MKTNFFMAIAMAIAAVMSPTVNAQPQRMQPYSGKSPAEVKPLIRPPQGLSLYIGSLDDKQREDINKIRTEQVKERTQTNNLLKEKRAKLEQLQTADKADMIEINKIIDEIAALQAKEMKSQADSRQKIRNLLSEEQRTYYDAQTANRGFARPEINAPAGDSRIRVPRTNRPQQR